MASSMLALLAMLRVVERSGGRHRLAWVAVLVVTGPIAVLIRGNALAIAPALFFGVLRSGGPGERAQRVILGSGLLAIMGTFAAWSLRSEQKHYDGIHNVTYLKEIQARDIGALWEASGKFGDGVERVDAVALANRAYVNFAWYQVYRVAGFLVPSSASLPGVKLSKLGFVLALVFLVPFGVGFASLAKRTPELAMYLAFSLLLVVVYPTGGSPRMLVPIIPILLAAGYLGLERMICPRAAIGWLIGLAVLNLANCVVEADRQRLQPYSRAGFNDFLRIIDTDLPKVSALRRDDRVGFPGTRQWFDGRDDPGSRSHSLGCCGRQSAFGTPGLPGTAPHRPRSRGHDHRPPRPMHAIENHQVEGARHRADIDPIGPTPARRTGSKCHRPFHNRYKGPRNGSVQGGQDRG